MDRSKSSPSSALSSSSISSPPILIYGHHQGYSNGYGYPPPTPISYTYRTPASPYSTTTSGTYPAYTPMAQSSSPYPYTPLSAGCPRNGPATASPALLFGHPDSMYASPSSSVSSLMPPSKDGMHTPPGLDMQSNAILSMAGPGYYHDPFGPPYGFTDAHLNGNKLGEAQVKKRSRTAQACEKCRIRKAKVSRPSSCPMSDTDLCLKCSGGQPCTRCINKRLPCVFSATSRARGASRYKTDHVPEGHSHVDTKLKNRRHSLADPFTSVAAKLPRRHSEGGVPSISPPGGALGLELTPPTPLTGEEEEGSPKIWTNGYYMAAPPSVVGYGTPQSTLTTPTHGTFPWTPDTPAVPLQYGLAPHEYSCAGSAGAWEGQPYSA